MAPEKLRNLPRGMGAIVDPSNVPDASEYWLGIGCAPVPAALRTQLNVPEKQGLLVEGVAPDSPAAKAGIAQYDILLRAGDKPLAEPRELVKAIEAAKESKLKIELIHDGKPKTIEATPAKRPEEARRHGRSRRRPPGDWETMEKWMERMWPGEERDGERPPMRFRFFHPGAIVPSDGNDADAAAAEHERGHQQGGRPAGEDRRQTGRREMGSDREGPRQAAGRRAAARGADARPRAAGHRWRRSLVRLRAGDEAAAPRSGPAA